MHARRGSRSWAPAGTAGDGEASVAPVGMDELERLVAAQRPDVVVLADERTFGEAVDRLLDARSRVRVASLSAFCERVLGRVPVRAIGPAWFMCLVDLRQHVYSRPSKRVFDIVAAVVGLVLAAPLLAVDGAPHEDDARTGALPPDARRGGRSLLHRPEDPDDAMRRRGRTARRSRVTTTHA